MMTDNKLKIDSPISYTVVEGEISSGATSPATSIVDTNTVDTMDTTTTPPKSPEPARPQNFVVHIENPADKPVIHKSLSNERKSIAAKAKRTVNQDVQFNPNHKPIAKFAYQSNQVHAAPLCQSTPVIQPTMQHVYYTNPYNSNMHTHPPMSVFPPPIVYKHPCQNPCWNHLQIST